MMPKIVILVFAILYVSIIDAKVTQEDVNNAKNLLTRISQLDNRCTESSDCATVSIRAPSCSAPSDYIVYSKLSAYAGYIQKLALLTSKLEEEYKKENSARLVCSVVAEPVLMCRENICARTSFVLPINL